MLGLGQNKLFSLFSQDDYYNEDQNSFVNFAQVCPVIETGFLFHLLFRSVLEELTDGSMDAQ